MERILIVDDDITFGLMLKTWLSKKGFGTQTAASAAAARTALAEGGFSLVLSDMRLPDEDGIALLQWMSGQRIEVPVIVMTSYAEIQNAVRCMKLGARDYVAKPVNPDELLKKIREALDAPAPVGDVPPVTPEKAPETSRAAGGDIPNYIEGQSDAARQLYEYVRLVAPTNMSVLVNGASGTGKEHVAQLIHRQSKRAGKPFVAVDCGAIPRDLAASEFFGHVKGSFTGAVGDKTGAFEAASGGTLFLDEVGNLTYETQVQLLRALQERRIRPVGSNREVAVDIRLVAATNEDLEAAIARGTFRADLYHRINEFTLRMPEVRQMREDIMLYADFFLDQANRQLDKHIVGFDGEAAAAMVRYDWPGNLRQMKNTVMSATLLCRGDYISCRELPAEIAGVSGAVAVPLRNPAGEEEQIRRALWPGGTSRRPPNCSASTARPFTTNCTSTGSSDAPACGIFPHTCGAIPHFSTYRRLWHVLLTAVIQWFSVFCPHGTPLGLSKVRKVDGTNYEPEEMKWNLKSLRAMKKTIVTMAALMLMAGSAFACAQQPEKKDASAATEAAAPATESPATDGQEKSESGDADKTDSTAGESAKEENKVESTSTSEGNSSSASEASATSK